ncbi:hypothetical protein Dimus_004789 [Dionaea muscipula]
MGCVEIVELGLIKWDFRVLGIVVDLHRLDIGCRDLAVWAFQLGVAALLLARSIGQPRFAAAPVGGCRVDLRRDFLRRVLLRLRLPCHGGQLAIDWNDEGDNLTKKLVLDRGEERRGRWKP